MWSAVAGLSPRMRGNQQRCTNHWKSGRSIPAYAGEPGGLLRRYRRKSVYPRVCGGTPRVCGGTPAGGRCSAGMGGLSPRMRGNHSVAVRRRRGRGSIPAYAGEPLRLPRRIAPAGVYPRVCGGTGWGVDREIVRKGLSPRMRGNRGRRIGCRVPARSIPAYAGEPAWILLCLTRTWVYPRVCGGT